MSSFFEYPVSQLVPGRVGKYAHWFGGPPAHSGVVPPGREHPVHLLYDLDLSDPALGLASRFPGLSRLPLYNALQYDCCAMIYRVESDEGIRILALDPERPDWSSDHPYDNYPSAFPRTPIIAEPVARDLVEQLARIIDGEGGYVQDLKGTAWDNDRDLIPRVGGRHFMWQGVPCWECPTDDCAFAGEYGDENKKVFAVLWERPVPGLNLWDDDPKATYIGSYQIIFSRCLGCGVIHSCNRCD